MTRNNKLKKFKNIFRNNMPDSVKKGIDYFAARHGLKKQV